MITVWMISKIKIGQNLEKLCDHKTSYVILKLLKIMLQSKDAKYLLKFVSHISASHNMQNICQFPKKVITLFVWL